MTPVHGDDDAVVEAFRAGDEGVVAAVYGRWSPLVYSLALRSLGAVGEAEAVTAAVFTRAWGSRDAFDPAQGRFSDWLVTLALSSIAATRAGRDTETVPEESGGAESKTGALAERLLVADGMAHLDDASQRMLRMALDQDLTFAEIAVRTGLPVEDVRSSVVTSLNGLRHRLEVDVDAH